MAGPLLDTTGFPRSRAGRTNRRAALRLFGAGAGAGAVLASGGAAAAWQAATPASATPAAQTSTDSFVYRLAQAAPVSFPSGAMVQFARAAEFPALAGMSFALFDIDQNAARELHWHNNASELGWCLGGTGQMVILDAFGVPVSFPLDAGTVFFAPQGLPHAFWTTGPEPMRFLLGFDDTQPATFDFSQVMPALPPAIVARMGNLPVTEAPSFPIVPKQFAAPVPGGTAALPVAAPRPSVERFATRIADAAAESFGGGTLNRITATEILELDGMATALLTLEPGAGRQPHWHPTMDEAAFVLEGSVEVGVLGPAAHQIETLDAGDLAFVPMNWLHFLTNVGDEPARVILFHDRAPYQAVELASVLAGVPAAVLAASYGLDPAALVSLADGDQSPIAGPP